MPAENADSHPWLRGLDEVTLVVMGSRASRAITYVLIFAAGVAALSWELVWQLEASLAIGVSAMGTAITLAATMGGMTLGSLAMGRLLRRYPTTRPLRVYALLEAAIGITGGVMLLPGFRFIERLDATIFAHSPGLAPLLHLVGIFLVVAPASVAMGATVPCLGLIARAQRSSIATLYSLNTAGAAAGVLLVSFVILPALGVELSTIAMACVDLGIAAVAWLLQPIEETGQPAVDAPAETAASASAAERTPLALTDVVVIMTGLVAFGLEVAWFRALRAAFTSTTQSFAIVLASVLIPLAIGARVASRAAPGPRFLALALSGAGTLIVLATPLVERLDRVFRHLFILDFWLLALAWFVAALLTLGPSMLLLGACLPHLLREQKEPARWGRLYALNTLGAVVGSLVTAWVLLPRLGFAHTTWLFGVSIVALGATIAAGRARLVAVALGTTALVVAAYTDEHLGTKRLMLSSDAPIARIVAFEEGPDSTLAVVDDTTGSRALVIDGFRATEQSLQAHYMTWMGRLPMLLSEHPDRALVICFGTGQTANAVRSEGPGALDVVELNPAVLRMGPLFDKNERVLEDPRVQPVAMDGRAWLRRTTRTYDVVTLEPMPPNFSGVNALYSKEFYELVARRLRPGGVVAQWVPFHLLSIHDALAITATFHEVLGDSLLWIDPVDHTGILVGRVAGAATPLGTSWPGFSRGGNAVARDLTEDAILGAVALRGAGIERYASLGEIVTDDNQLLAYGTSRHRLPFAFRAMGDANLDLVRHETLASSSIIQPPPSAAPSATSAPPAPSPAPGLAWDPITVGSEPSKWGRFELTLLPPKDKDTTLDQCSVSFKPSGGGDQPLFVVPDCGGGPAGIGTVGAIRHLGSLALPALGPRAELHLFQIASARGGNATRGFESWVVSVGDTGGCDAKCPGAFVRPLGTDVYVETGAVDVNPRFADAVSIVLERPSTRTEKGVRYEITSMPTLEVKEHALPLRTVTVKSRARRVLDHVVIDQGLKFTNFRPTIARDGPTTDELIIDEDGPCDLKILPVKGRVTLEETTWSNGDTSTKCLQVDR